jgi:DNA-binding FadR family transcriptional regulator
VILPTRGEAIADRLATDIAAGRYPRGSLLPGERSLCQTLGVGRPLLREAIRLLAARGLVEIRHGQGTRVIADHGRPVRGAFVQALSDAPATRSTHLLELRLPLEAAIARAAAQRRSAADLADLEAILAAFAARVAASPGDLDGLAALDVRFHARLAEAAANPLFIAVLGPLAGLLEEDRQAGLADLTPATALADHRRILAAVQARRPEVAARAMAAHLRRVARAGSLSAPASRSPGH